MTHQRRWGMQGGGGVVGGGGAVLSLHYQGRDPRHRRLSGAGVGKLRPGGAICGPLSFSLRLSKLREVISIVSQS